MNEIVSRRNKLLAQTVIKGLESRNMTGYYAADRAEALRIALSLIPEGSSVTNGGTASAAEIGLLDQKHAKSAPCAVPRRAGSGDAPADYQDIVFSVVHLACRRL